MHRIAKILVAATLVIVAQGEVVHGGSYIFTDLGTIDSTPHAQSTDTRSTRRGRSPGSRTCRTRRTPSFIRAA